MKSKQRPNWTEVLTTPEDLIGSPGDLAYARSTGILWIKERSPGTPLGWRPIGGNPPDTIHFNIGGLGGIPAPTAPGTPNPATMGFYGQLNIATPRTIQFTHIHLTEDGAAPSRINMEFWRERNGVFTRLTEPQYVAPAGNDFLTVGATPVGDLAQLERGDYLYVQHVTGTTLAGGGSGLTLDIHFLPL